MSRWDTPNIYYNPEKFGLEIVAELNDERCYNFNTTLVFRKEDGTMWYLHDSGCSCPIPFEGYGIEDLEPIGDPICFIAKARGWHYSPTDYPGFVSRVIELAG